MSNVVNCSAWECLALYVRRNCSTRSPDKSAKIIGLAVDGALLDLVSALKVSCVAVSRILDGKHATWRERAKDVLDLLLQREVSLMLGDKVREGEVERCSGKLGGIDPAISDVLNPFQSGFGNVEDADLATQFNKLASVAAKANANVESPEAGNKPVTHSETLPDFLAGRSGEPIGMIGLVGRVPPVFDNG